MDKGDIRRAIHDAIVDGLAARRMSPDETTASLGVPKLGTVAMIPDLREGAHGGEVSLLLGAASALGLTPMLVPAEAVDAVRQAIEAVKEEPLPSVWDEVFVDLSGDEDPEGLTAPWKPAR